MPSINNFDPIKVANIELRMWQTYYRGNFLKLTWLLYVLIKTQFGTGIIKSMLAAYHSSRAAIIYRKKTSSDSRVKLELKKLYTILKNSSRTSFDPNLVAGLELEWWDVHRNRHTSKDLERALSDEMSELYGVDKESLEGYAESRAIAMRIRKQSMINGDLQPDWQAIERYLIVSFKQLDAAVN